MTIVTATQLATWLSIPDSEDDQRLLSAAAATNRAIANYCGRTFETTNSGSSSSREFQAKSWTLCDIDDISSSAGLIVKTGDGDGTYPTTLAAADYVLEPLNEMQDGLTFPYHRIRTRDWIFDTTWCLKRNLPNVQVTTDKWGWASIPADVTLAALIKGARLFKRKDSPEGVLGGFQDFGVRVSTKADPDVVDLLRPYQTPAAANLMF